MTLCIDEFHFGMMSSRTVDGVKIGDRGNKALSHEVVMLLKTQDVGYLRTMLQKTRIERQRLESALILEEDDDDTRVKVLGQDGKPSQRKIFVDSVDEQDGFVKARMKLDKVDGIDKDEGLANGDTEAVSDEASFEGFGDLDSIVGVDGENQEDSQTSQSRSSHLKMLQALKKREEELTTATRELELQRARMSNSIGGVNKKGVKFKIRERKR
jgi:U3 small nucleolar RNA-associated protein 11